LQTTVDKVPKKGVETYEADPIQKSDRIVELTTNSQDPSSEQLQTIIDLHTQGLWQQALSEVGQMLKRFPNSAVLYNIAGASNVGLMQLDAAIISYKQSLKIKPDYAQAYNNMAIALNANGDQDGALASYKQALRVKPDYADVFINMGIMLNDQGDLEAAIDSYKQALKIMPNNAKVLNNMGVALMGKGDPEAAIGFFKQALKITPDDAEVYNNMGVALMGKSDPEEAIKSYKQALIIKPHYVEAYLNACELYEKSNKLAELSEVIFKAKVALKELPSDLLFYEALYNYRTSNYDQCEKLISLIVFDQLDLQGKFKFQQLKAKVQHHQKDYQSAFNSFAEMNNSIIDSSGYNFKESQVFFDEILMRVKDLSSSLATPYCQISEASSADTPIFLIGFPRSGTTLLDTILRTHSKIEVVEEGDMLSKTKRHLGNQLGVFDIENLTSQELSKAKDVYFQALAKHVVTNNNTSIIDKLPLNILEVPIIHKLFPASKFILVVRHPLDSILSCWMQTFKLNAPMANMLQLDRIVDFYITAMSILELSEKRYQLTIHKIRYEDLISDMKTEVSNLLNYLELEWEIELETYQQTALERGFINTPSYSQVIEPIYNTASYRWEKYRESLEKYFIKIEKWTTKYGYEL
jgi:Tfp pilus assembly protein PilF